MNFFSFSNTKVLSRLLMVKRVNYVLNRNFFRLFSPCFHLQLSASDPCKLAVNYKASFNTKSSSGNINHLLCDALKHKDLQRTVELFDFAKREGVIPEAKMYTQALYLLMKMNEYDKLDELYEEMSKHGFKAGEGVRVTLIRSYVYRKMWNKALDALDQLEKQDLLRHTRSFNIIIKGLLEEGLVHLAFQLFERKLNAFHRISTGNENITNDVKMYAAMIKACCSNSESQTINNRAETPSEKSQIQMFQSSANNSNKHSLVYQLFQFFYNFGMKLPPDVLNACKEWSIYDENHIWSWQFCAINKTGKCNICGTILQEDLAHDYFRDLQEELIKLFSCEDGNLKLSQAQLEELKHVRVVCKDKSPFNVIIDAQNIGLEGRRKDISTLYVNKVYERRIVEVVKHFSKKNKTIFLPLNVKALKDISGNTLSFLRSHCEVHIVKTSIDEDLVVLYAAALSGMDGGTTCVVTNDNWRDHCAMLSKENHWKLLKWTRLNHISFAITQKSRVKLHSNLFDPAIVKMSKSWHFPMENGHWQCAKLTGK